MKNTFNITTEGDTQPTNAEEQEAIFGRMKQNLRDINQTEVIFNPAASPEPLFCTLLPEELHLCSLPRENRGLCAYGILKLVFFSEQYVCVRSMFFAAGVLIFFDPSPHTFFSVSETEDEISMLLSKEALSFFPEDAMTVSELWRPIQRFKKTSYSAHAQYFALMLLG